MRYWRKWGCFIALGAYAVVVLGMALSVWRARDSQIGSVQTTLKQWGVVFAMYADASPAKEWPHLASDPDRWVMDVSQLFPEYVSGPGVLISPAHPRFGATFEALERALVSEPRDWDTANRLTAESFGYMGHIFMNVADVEALVRARASGRLASLPVGFDMDGDGRLIPLRENAERFLADIAMGPAGQFKELRAEIPVLVDVSRWRDKSYSHFDGRAGTYVLYMDGHVAFVPLGTFPVVPEVMDVLCGL
jgi:hypothetical protein